MSLKNQDSGYLQPFATILFEHGESQQMLYK